MNGDQTFYLWQLVVGWTCVGVFVCTAVITLLAMVGLLRMDAGERAKLFAVLIVEIVVVCVALFANLIQVDPAPVEEEVQAVAAAEQTVQTLSPSLPLEPNAPTTAEPAPAPSEVPPRVYIHIASESQRDLATAARSAIRAAGQVVPGIENVGTGPDQTELRYFVESEGELAKAISAELEAAGIDAPVSSPDGSTPAKSARTTSNSGLKRPERLNQFTRRLPVNPTRTRPARKRLPSSFHQAALVHQSGRPINRWEAEEAGPEKGRPFYLREMSQRRGGTEARM